MDDPTPWFIMTVILAVVWVCWFIVGKLLPNEKIEDMLIKRGKELEAKKKKEEEEDHV